MAADIEHDVPWLDKPGNSSDVLGVPSAGLGHNSRHKAVSPVGDDINPIVEGVDQQFLLVELVPEGLNIAGRDVALYVGRYSAGNKHRYGHCEGRFGEHFIN